MKERLGQLVGFGCRVCGSVELGFGGGGGDGDGEVGMAGRGWLTSNYVVDAWESVVF